MKLKAVSGMMLTLLLTSIASSSSSVTTSSDTVYVFKAYVHGHKPVDVLVESNSSLYNFAFGQQSKKVSFFIAGPIGSTFGFCNVAIPKTLLWLESPSDVWEVSIDGVTPIDLLITENTTHTMLYFTYTHLTGHTVQIFGSGVAQPLRVYNINTGLNYVTIQEAINAPETLCGHTIWADKGTYYEHIVVNKTVHIKAMHFRETFINGNKTPGTVVTITADNVVVSGFIILNGGSRPEDAGIRLDNSHGTRIGGNVLINNSIGISLVNSDNNDIGANDIEHCEYCGIDLRNSHSNAIGSNYMKKHGIQLRESNSNTLHRNRVFEAEYGISLKGNHNKITFNQFERNEIGINLQGNYSNIIRNTIKSSIQFGVKLSGRDNVVYHNNLIDNSKQVWTNSINSWDDGYPSGGNYWSDHPSVDCYSGPNQDVLGSDGISDTPYVIDAYNQDRYPLMMWPPPQIVVSFYPPKNKVALGETFTVDINVLDIVLGEWYLGLYGWDVELKFDSNVLNIVEATEGPFLKTVSNETTWTLMPPKIDNEAGTIAMGNTFFPPLPPKGATGSGTLATITFKAVGVGATSLHFDYTGLYSVIDNVVLQIGKLYPVFTADGIVIVPVPAALDIFPNTLNLRSKSKWVTAYIELPQGYDVEDIDISTILINDTIPAVEDSKYDFVTDSSEYITDHDGDGVLECMVKFIKTTVTEYITDAVGIKYEDLTLTITGEVDGTIFEGSDTIRVG